MLAYHMRRRAEAAPIEHAHTPTFIPQAVHGGFAKNPDQAATVAPRDDDGRLPPLKAMVENLEQLCPVLVACHVQFNLVHDQQISTGEAVDYLGRAFCAVLTSPCIAYIADDLGSRSVSGEVSPEGTIFISGKEPDISDSLGNDRRDHGLSRASAAGEDQTAARVVVFG